MAKSYKLHDKLDDLALYLMTNKQGHVDILLDYMNVRNLGCTQIQNKWEGNGTGVWKL